MNTKLDTGWPEPAKLRLVEVYQQYGSETVEQKAHTLQVLLGGEHNFYAAGGVTEEMKLACLEHEFLLRENLIDVTLS